MRRLGKFPAESFHAPCRIDEPLLACEEGMALGTDLDP
jgi:hypothetical protein